MWIEAIVMPGAESSSDAHRFHETVLDFLQAQELMGAVRWVSEPGALALVTLQCSPSVLEHLRQAPGFEAGRSMALELHT